MNKDTQSTNFMQVIPDSHMWTSIDMLLNWLTYEKLETIQRNLVIGLNNTKKEGYDLVKASYTGLNDESGRKILEGSWIKDHEGWEWKVILDDGTYKGQLGQRKKKLFDFNQFVRVIDK